MKFFKNIWNLIPAILGLIQSTLPIIKEIAVSVVRLIGILPLLWDVPEPIIERINEIYDTIYEWVEKIKNFILLVS